MLGHVMPVQRVHQLQKVNGKLLQETMDGATLFILFQDRLPLHLTTMTRVVETVEAEQHTAQNHLPVITYQGAVRQQQQSKQSPHPLHQ